jgi:hypothetical protein
VRSATPGPSDHVGSEPEPHSVSGVSSEEAPSLGRPLTGTVRWWKEEKCYGRITGDYL